MCLFKPTFEEKKVLCLFVDYAHGRKWYFTINAWFCDWLLFFDHWINHANNATDNLYFRIKIKRLEKGRWLIFFCCWLTCHAVNWMHRRNFHHVYCYVKTDRADLVFQQPRTVTVFGTTRARKGWGPSRQEFWKTRLNAQSGTAIVTHSRTEKKRRFLRLLRLFACIFYFLPVKTVRTPLFAR